jgi:hypothetical protein
MQSERSSCSKVRNYVSLRRTIHGCGLCTMQSLPTATKCNVFAQVLSETSAEAKSRLSQITEKLAVELLTVIDSHLEVRS